MIKKIINKIYNILSNYNVLSEKKSEESVIESRKESKLEEDDPYVIFTFTSNNSIDITFDSLPTLKGFYRAMEEGYISMSVIEEIILQDPNDKLLFNNKKSEPLNEDKKTSIVFPASGTYGVDL